MLEEEQNLGKRILKPSQKEAVDVPEPKVRLKDVAELAIQYGKQAARDEFRLLMKRFAIGIGTLTWTVISIIGGAMLR
jgi:hypothetical protein